MRPVLKSSTGFSLVELMVALMLSFLAVIAMFRSYVALQVGAEAQEKEAEISQNLRVGLKRISRALQMAAYDPLGEADSKFISAGATSVRFTTDYSEDGDFLDSDVGGNGFADEHVEFSWGGADGDPLQRTDHNTAAAATIIPNVSGLQFYYLTSSGAQTIDLTAIRDVEVWMLTRATNEDFAYVNTNIYATARGDVLLAAPNDNFRRRMMVVRVKVRNMGL